MRQALDLYGSASCKFCTLAREYLEGKNYRYVYHDVAVPEIKAALKRRFPDVKTIPQIFAGSHHIGGYDDLRGADHIIQQFLFGE